MADFEYYFAQRESLETIIYLYDVVEVLGYDNYRNFEGVIEKAKLSCFNSGHRIEDHFVDVDEMIAIGSGTMPENLPVADSIKKIEIKERKRIGDKYLPEKKEK
jgi:hypothetical protein